MDLDNLQQAAELVELIATGDRERLRTYLKDVHPADIAFAIAELPIETKALVLDLLSDEDAALVLLELDKDEQVELLRLLGKARSRLVLNEMGADDIADLLRDLGASDVNEMLALLEYDDSAEVRRILGYPERSAGGIMTTEFVSLPETMTAAKAIAYLRSHAPEAETVYYVYVTDERSRLVGVLSLRDLITAAVDARLSEFMQRNVISVRVADDQEEVAQVVAKYDLLAVPVVDEEERLVGIVTVDDVIDVLEQEVTEDIHRLSGTLAGDHDLDRPLQRVKKRLPWLVILLFGNMLSATVLRSFTSVLEAVVLLAYFVPVLIDMGGNVGIQSLAVTVRALATRELDGRRIGKALVSEAQVGLTLGLACGALVTLVAYLWQGNLYLGLVVGMSLLITMLASSLVGTIMPLVLDRLGFDAAVASGPLITTVVDVLGLLIYFGTASWMLRLIA